MGLWKLGKGLGAVDPPGLAQWLTPFQLEHIWAPGTICVPPHHPGDEGQRRDSPPVVHPTQGAISVVFLSLSLSKMPCSCPVPLSNR